MKAHLTKLSLALLSAVFLLGCQEQASSPVGLEGPQFDKKGDPGTLCPGGTELEGPFRDDKGHCHGEDDDAEGTFTATIIGDVISVVDIVLHETAVGLQTFAGTPDVEGTPAMLDLTFFRNNAGIPDGETCFNSAGAGKVAASVFTAPFQIIVKENDLPDVLSFLEPFEAKGDDGSTLVKYRLELFGKVTGEGTFSPDAGEITTIELETFNMRHSSGPGRKFACTGTGTLKNSFIEVTGTSTTS